MNPFILIAALNLIRSGWLDGRLEHLRVCNSWRWKHCWQNWRCLYTCC